MVVPPGCVIFRGSVEYCAGVSEGLGLEQEHSHATAIEGSTFLIRLFIGGRRTDSWMLVSEILFDERVTDGGNGGFRFHTVAGS